MKNGDFPIDVDFGAGFMGMVWEGIGRQNMHFGQTISELVDNSISAVPKDQYGTPTAFRVEIIIANHGDEIEVLIADQSCGIEAKDLSSCVLSLGGSGPVGGVLNEHGYGLKNAICSMTRGNKMPFRIETSPKHVAKDNQIFFVDGPFHMGMKVDTAQGWSENDLTNTLDQHSSIGTRIYVSTTMDHVRTVYPSGKSFASYMDRIGEFLGIRYRGLLEHHKSNRILLKWIDKDDIKSKKIIPIEIPYCGEVTERHFDIEGEKIIYRFGRLNESKPKDTGMGWPYELMLSYQCNQRTQGVDIVCKGIVLKSGVFTEIFDRSKHNKYNEFCGEIILPDSFSTIVNKTDITTDHPGWVRLCEILSSDIDAYTIKRDTNAIRESLIRQQLIKILTGHNPGAKVQIEKSIGGVEIDISVRNPDGTIYIMELKAGNAEPKDIGQLLLYAYCIRASDGKIPERCILVASGFNSSVEQIAKTLSEKCDINIELLKREEAIGE
ncbi:hypothetical protein LCGC14_1230780 [marine sediment metagenome]|uniref:DUF91 domain-containing protein n=1 Tax=marine sediment metagenome TaxID=412755 RepID=A0A0F9NQT3_9ZZZZ